MPMFNTRTVHHTHYNTETENQESLDTHKKTTSYTQVDNTVLLTTRKAASFVINLGIFTHNFSRTRVPEYFSQPAT